MKQVRPSTPITAGSKSSQLRFQLLITLVMRVILIRDAIVALWAGRRMTAKSSSPTRPVPIISGTRRLEARLLLPPELVWASVVILHGIGERLEYWQEAQELLAKHGIASFIFHYSGYGKSTGALTPANLREDTLTAYAELQRLAPCGRMPFLLGLSLGTGIAVDAMPNIHPPPSGLILCQPFTSFRAAAAAVLKVAAFSAMAGHMFAKLVPDIYRTSASIRQIASPLLLIHSDADALFPLAMSREIFAAAEDGRAILHIPHGFAHNDAYLNPSLRYWQPILDFMKSPHVSASPNGLARR